MKIKLTFKEFLAEARYAFTATAKCTSCSHEFDFERAAEHTLSKQNARCPKCGTSNTRDRAEKYLQDHQRLKKFMGRDDFDEMAGY